MNDVETDFEKQLQFIIETDKLKHIFRKTKLFDSSRFENDAEHAWHLALMALVFADHANEKKIDILKVLKMVLIHDLVEIDAGDVIVYDTRKRDAARKTEEQAAERIFGILPENQKNEFIALWKEFEEKETPEAAYAASLDRFEPILQNHMTDYYTWRANNIGYARLIEVNNHVQNGSAVIWKRVQRIFAEAKDKGAIR